LQAIQNAGKTLGHVEPAAGSDKMVYAMNTEAIRSDWVGRGIDGRFTLLQWLGGSDGSGVFLTELEGHGSQKAAIKLIPADGRDAEARIAGWAAATALSHPHLIRLFHSGRCEMDSAPLLYVVTEYADEVLSQILPERSLTPSEAKEMLDPVLDALSYLHGKGFMHGRLKPSNIMAVGDQLKLSSDRLHAAGELVKHFPALSVYDAPEAATEPISPAADVWSLGVTLVETLTQHPPVWDRSTDSEPAVPESVPEPFAGMARECLRRDPARRCTLSDVKARLDAARSLPEPASKPGGTAPAKLRLAGVIAAAVVVIAVIAALLTRSHQTQPTPPAEEQQSAPATAALPAQSPIPETQTSTGAAVKGAVVKQVLPDVPKKASDTIQGRIHVRIRVTVDASGDVSDAAFDSPGGSKYFANLALEAARKWKFTPAQVHSEAVSSVWILTFEFRQTGTEATPVETSP
jgi:serine/threonine-protein kinase